MDNKLTMQPEVGILGTMFDDERLDDLEDAIMALSASNVALANRLSALEQTLNKTQEALRIASKYENDELRRQVEGIQAALDRAATAAPRKERRRPQNPVKRKT